MADSPVIQQPKRTERLHQRYLVASRKGRVGEKDLRYIPLLWLWSAAGRRRRFASSLVAPLTPQVSPFWCDVLAQYQGIVPERVMGRRMLLRSLMRARYRRIELQGMGLIRPLP